MTLNFSLSLPEALADINFQEYQGHHEFIIHDKDEERIYSNSDEIIGKYGEIKWKIVDLVNARYSHILKDKFDLYNWINKNKQDELSYFLNEAGSNSLLYSQFKAPFKFHLWLGENSFIVGIEQKGQGFNAEKINSGHLKENRGAAFQFFRESQSQVFFDDPKQAKVVYLFSKMG